MRSAKTALEAIPVAMVRETDLAAALHQGAVEAIDYLRAVVTRGQQALQAQRTARLDRQVFSTLINCATAAGKTLAMLQLRVDEARYRRAVGEDDALGVILKRVEEAEGPSLASTSLHPIA